MARVIYRGGYDRRTGMDRRSVYNIAYFEQGGFERGIRDALEATLASPFFVLRLEREPTDVKPGEVYRLGDIELASRLSFFLWGTPPDDELLEVTPSELRLRKKLLKESDRKRDSRRKAS